jgi:hypothetical protein
VSWRSVQSATVTFAIEVNDEISSSSVGGVQVFVCGSSNTDCPTQPLGSGKTDPAGRVLIQVPQNMMGQFYGLDGYLQLVSTATVPELWYWGFPVNGANVAFNDAPNQRLAVGVFTPMELDADYQAVQLVRDPMRGTIVAVTEDCLSNAAPGVRVSIDKSGGGIVQSYGISESLTATQTDSTAVSSFANVPPGTVTVTATPVAVGKVSSQAIVLVKPGTVTVVWLAPTP